MLQSSVCAFPTLLAAGNRAAAAAQDTMFANSSMYVGPDLLPWVDIVDEGLLVT